MEEHLVRGVAEFVAGGVVDVALEIVVGLLEVTWALEKAMVLELDCHPRYPSEIV
jgi:hypothetical protein